LLEGGSMMTTSSSSVSSMTSTITGSFEVGTELPPPGMSVWAWGCISVGNLPCVAFFAVIK